jgi:hypothetical protein
MTAVAVPITTALVSQINRREAEIREAGKTMLLLAKEQGEDLLRLKDQTPHGEFKERVERETCLSYVLAWRYKRVAELVKNFGDEILGRFTGIDELIAAYADEGRAGRPRKARPPITREDAEYALRPRLRLRKSGMTPVARLTHEQHGLQGRLPRSGRQCHARAIRPSGRQVRR